MPRKWTDRSESDPDGSCFVILAGDEGQLRVIENPSCRRKKEMGICGHELNTEWLKYAGIKR